jgi:hypothetical protein
MADFRADHPVVGVMWTGAALYCNWLSQQNGLQECYYSPDWSCDFTKSGFRLPTEAEWEYAARGGHLNPYLNYPNGNIVIGNQTNIPVSGDPYETGDYPNTTPVGFYDGTLKLKSNYNWPGSATSYQTTDGVNGFGLYDVQGNVWELLNDWYGQNYYSISPYNNPTGPATGFIMPDGKPYRGMRGGNWYNGYTINNINDGHSRVSNRNPSYYRGPQDPNHPWYHVGFRVARKYGNTLGLNSPGDDRSSGQLRLKNYSNPFRDETRISFSLPAEMKVKILIYNTMGVLIAKLSDERIASGFHELTWNSARAPEGVYFCTLISDNYRSTIRMVKIR